jgi:hypothetical protein
MRAWLKKHKKIAAIVTLLACVEVWQLAAPVRGHLAARFDVARGHYKLLVFGLPPSSRPGYARLLRERYNITVHTAAYCIVSREMIAYVRSYDEVSAAAANRKFGHDVFKECSEEADRRGLSRQKNPQNIPVSGLGFR